MWTLLFSARQKSPELEIPEGAFYDQIPGYNLYVKSKDKESGILRGVMIYDVSRGGDNSTILVADSARLAFTGDLRYLYLHLWQGEQFENLREQKTADRNVPFRRESFLDKEVLIPFDNNFNRLDEGGMRNQYVGKNMSELRQTIDSLQTRIDSIGRETRNGFEQTVFPVLGRAITGEPSSEAAPAPAGIMSDNTKPQKKTPAKAAAVAPVDLDSLLAALPQSRLDATFTSAANSVKMRRSEIEFRAMQLNDEKARFRRHQIELIKKFTLSVACIIFLFIGAPLGAIIRKGGLGTPLVISVLLFLVYYIIDNTGYKLA
ncbi:MAG: LptF/LptG family permease, partial [Muribaculaceae bacterium]|nr:LptF/LptG family permease [Muribaculaceae bacterium]